METFTITGKNLEIVLKKIEKQYGSAAKVISKKQVFLKQPFRKSLTKAIEITGVVDPDGIYQGEGESVEDLNRAADTDSEYLESDEEVPISPITIHRERKSSSIHRETKASSSSSSAEEILPSPEELLRYHLGLEDGTQPASAGATQDDDIESIDLSEFDSLSDDSQVSVPVYTDREQIQSEDDSFKPTPDMLRDADLRIQAIESLIQQNQQGAEEGKTLDNNTQNGKGQATAGPEQPAHSTYAGEPTGEKRVISSTVTLDRPAQSDSYEGLERQIPEVIRSTWDKADRNEDSWQSRLTRDREAELSASWKITTLPPEQEEEEAPTFEELLAADQRFNHSEEQQFTRSEETPVAASTEASATLPPEPLQEAFEEVTPATFTETSQAVYETPVTGAQILEERIAPAVNNTVLEGLVREIESLRKQLELKTSPRGSILTNISLKKMRELLSDNGFSSQLIDQLIDRITLELSPLDIKDYESLQAIVLQWIAELIAVPNSRYSTVPPVMVVVGEPGCGKTSLVAKLAAEFGVRGFGGVPKLTRMVSLDTRKVGAREEIYRYGTLMGLLVDVLTSIEEFDRLIDNSPDYGLILIDTPNSFAHTKGWVQDITKRMQELSVPMEVVLAISATTKGEDIEEILTRYSGMYTSIAITKLDQTHTVGNIFSALEQVEKPIRFITDGSKVPGYIRVPQVRDFMEKLHDFTIPYEDSKDLAAAAQYRKPMRGVSFSKSTKREESFQPTFDFLEPRE